MCGKNLNRVTIAIDSMAHRLALVVLVKSNSLELKRLITKMQTILARQ
jgi:hypothetical protein